MKWWDRYHDLKFSECWALKPTFSLSLQVFLNLTKVGETVNGEILPDINFCCFLQLFLQEKKGTCFPLLLETEKTETVSLSHPPYTECVGHWNTFRWGSATRTIGKIQFSTKYKFLGDRWGKMFYPVCIRFSLFFWRITLYNVELVSVI